MTLLELVVVLAVLAVLAGVAVRAMDGVMDQGRFEASQRLLGDVEAAILGPRGKFEPDGTPLTGGFVADIGSLPVAVEDNDGGLTLEELWLKADELTPFSVQTPAGDSEVRLPAGWRGPYLRLPIGADELHDGWGNRLELYDENFQPLAPGDLVKIIVSPGGPASPYNEPLELAIHWEAPDPDKPDPQRPRHFGDLSGQVHAGDEGPEPQDGQMVVVRVYGPDGFGNVVTLGQIEEPVGDNGEPEPIYYEFDQPVTIGTRIVRAYQMETAPDWEDNLDWVERKSPVTPVAIRPGAQMQRLNLPPPSEESENGDGSE